MAPTTLRMARRIMTKKLDAATEQQILDAYKKSPRGGTVLARQLGVGKTTLYRVLRLNNVALDPARQYNPEVRKRFTEEQEQEIVQLYESGLRAPEIARRFGCFPGTIRSVMHRSGVQMRRGVQRRHMPEEVIEDILQRHSSGESQSAIANDLGWDQTTISRVLRSHNKETRPMRDRHGSWKGGRTTNSAGYVLRMVESDSPFSCMCITNGYVMEHRLVMAEHLGRPLTADETVHHIDGNKQNNALENLQLRQGKHGRGEALCCRACGSTDLVPRSL